MQMIAWTGYRGLLRHLLVMWWVNSHSDTNNGMSQRHMVNEEKTHLQGQASLSQPPHNDMSVRPQSCMGTLSVPAGCSKRFKTEYNTPYT